MRRHVLVLSSVLLVLALAFTACAAAPASFPAPTAAGGVRNDMVAFSADSAVGRTAQMSVASPAAPMSPPPPGAMMEVAEEEAWFGDSYGSFDDSAYITPISADIAPVSAHNRMIVTTFHLSAETMDFEASVDFIISQVHDLGGYIQNSSVSGRSIDFEDRSARFAHFTVRVPAPAMRHFVAVLGDKTNVTSTQESADDITERFFDSQARLASLVNQERLLNQLLDGGGDLEFILEVHRELADVRHQIELLSSSIQRMERSVNYATAHISLREVMQFTPVEPMPIGFGERINQAMGSSWARFGRDFQNMVVRLIWDMPYHIMNLLGFLFWVVVFLIVRLIIRKRKGIKRGERTFDWLPAPRMKKVDSAKNDNSDENSESDK